MARFDATHYIGAWYELASIPMYFENECDQAMAVYQLEGKELRITNLCLSRGEIVSTISGKGISTDEPKHFRIEFAATADFPSPTMGSYWVYMTNYTSFSIVSNADKTSLWILARSPSYTSLQRQIYEALCSDLGLPVEKLRWR